MILYSSLLLGRKNWTFETGVQAALSLLDYKHTNKYIYNSTYVRDTTIFKEGNAGSITLGIPLGVRFQPARSAFFASFLVNTNLLYINNWDLSKTGEYTSKGFMFYRNIERISLSLGYTFPVKNKK